MKVGDLVECIADDERGRFRAGDRHRVRRRLGGYVDIGVHPDAWSVSRFRVVEEAAMRKKLREMEPGDRFIRSENRFRFIGECDGGWAVQVPSGDIPVWVDGDAEYEMIPPAPKPEARPFADASEFAPYREKWLRPKSNSHRRFIVVDYDDTWVQFVGNAPMRWKEAFGSYVFEDGSPFGVVDSVYNGDEA